jgi:hypothetical protein
MNIALQVRVKHGELWRILQKHGLSQVAFAKLAGLSTFVVYELVNLRHRPNVVTIDRLRQACLSLGEYPDIERWWPNDFNGCRYPVNGFTFFRDIDPQLLLTMNTPCISTEDKLLLEQALDDETLLDDRERTSIEGGLSGKTFSDIAHDIGRTRQRTCQIQKNAISKIRRYIDDHDIETSSVIESAT